MGIPVEKPRPGGEVLVAPGSERRAQARYRQAKATKRGGKGGKEAEHSGVPRKRGNPPEGTPWREGSAR